MSKGWYGNSQKHSMASKGIRVSESRDKYNGIMPYHKNIGGVKFTLKNNGEYTTKVSIPIYLTEKEVMEMLYDEKIRYEYDSIDDLRVSDLKKFIESRYTGAYELAYMDGSDLDKLDDDEDWQRHKALIEKQTEEYKKIIKEAKEKNK